MLSVVSPISQSAQQTCAAATAVLKLSLCQARFMLLFATKIHAGCHWVHVLCLTSVGFQLQTLLDLSSQVDIQEEVREATKYNLQTK